MPALVARLSIRRPATSSVALRLLSRQATRMLFTHKGSRLLRIVMVGVAVLMAASLAPGLPPTAVRAGLIWRVPKAARSETATVVSGDYPQNWYDQGIAVDPNNPDRVFFDTFDVWFATRTGTVWNDTTCGYSYSGAAGPVHVDQHALAFLPGSSSILAIGNDGGVHGTANADAATHTIDPTWFNMDTGINTIEFYSGDISGNFANAASPQASGGAQDNGSSSSHF